MPTVSMLKAKSNLSRLVAAVESGAESEAIIVRNGRPAATLVAVGPTAAGKRIGVAKGMFVPPEPDADVDAKLCTLFHGGAR
jgi:antitoxin (DNA-binding transcriptional repressor) of toxin-antitoxin stability system